MTETETLCNGKWLRLKRRGRWEFAERVNAGGGVIIVAVTPEDCVLLVEQYYDFAKSLADHYLVMSRGEIIKQGLGRNRSEDDRDAGRARR